MDLEQFLILVTYLLKEFRTKNILLTYFFDETEQVAQITLKMENGKWKILGFPSK